MQEEKKAYCGYCACWDCQSVADSPPYSRELSWICVVLEGCSRGGGGGGGKVLISCMTT